MTKWYTNSNFLSEFRNSKSNGFRLFETFRNAYKTHSKRNNNLRQKRLESNSIFPFTDRLRNSRECRPYTAGAYPWHVTDITPDVPSTFPRCSLDVPSTQLRAKTCFPWHENAATQTRNCAPPYCGSIMKSGDCFCIFGTPLPYGRVPSEVTARQCGA